jgi:hypothetical protein
MMHVRYHLITIAAIFLALGIGILIGGTAGQSWFSLTEKEFLRSMETKYDKALKSNNELKQQVNRLIIQVERSNEEVIHLMAVRYAEDLQGQKIYVWHPPELRIDDLQRVLQSVGVDVQAYQPGQTVDDPLLIMGRELPSWVRQLPPKSKWLHVESMPDSPAKQWKLLESVQILMREKRVELEKR